MKIGLLFAGQGAQHSGMGKSLYEKLDTAKEVMDLAGPEIKEWCFNGTKEMLRQTQITQPCIYTVTMAAYEALSEKISQMTPADRGKLEISGVAGFSLGEYAALTASGVIDSVGKGLEIVKSRGTWMSEAGMDENGEPIGGMIATFGEREKILQCVADVREDGILEGVNFNSPSQTVVAGDKASLERFRTHIKEKAKEGEHLKAVPLSVSTAFHSTMMLPAVPKLMTLLLKSKLKMPNVKVYSNVTGRDMMEGFSPKARREVDSEAESAGGQNEDVGRHISERMGVQAKSPVYWQETIENMQKDGIQVFIELGPGNTLSGLVKKIDHEAITMNVADYENLTETMERLAYLVKRETAGQPLTEDVAEE